MDAGKGNHSTASSAMKNSKTSPRACHKCNGSRKIIIVESISPDFHMVRIPRPVCHVCGGWGTLERCEYGEYKWPDKKEDEYDV